MRNELVIRVQPNESVYCKVRKGTQDCIFLYVFAYNKIYLYFYLKYTSR